MNVTFLGLPGNLMSPIWSNFTYFPLLTPCSGAYSRFGLIPVLGAHERLRN
jgi:hypothetical protein